MLAIVVKLVLTPAFVVAASLAARRFGPLVGGLVGGLPIVGGPILLAFALDQGATFGAQAARGTLLGLISLTVFVVLYAWLAGRLRWRACLLSGVVAFFAATAVLATLHVAPAVALVLACGAFAIAQTALPPAPPPLPGETTALLPSWDLPARAASSLALVLILTAAASALGPHLSGLLTPFPTLASILAAFTHAHAGALPTRRLARGLVLGYFAFAAFCFTVAETIEPLGIAAGFGLATVAALLTQAVVVGIVVTARRRGALTR